MLYLILLHNDICKSFVCKYISFARCVDTFPGKWQLLAPVGSIFLCHLCHNSKGKSDMGLAYIGLLSCGYQQL